MKKTQRQAIFELLLNNLNNRVGMPQLVHCHGQFIARIGARIHEIRKSLPEGLKLETKIRRVKGVKQSWYRLSDNQQVSESNENMLNDKE